MTAEPKDKRENRQPNGRFGAGNCANPHGAGNVPKEFNALARRKSLPALEFCIAVVEGKVRKAPLSQKLRAAELIMDRGFGKPQQGIDVNVYTDLSIGELAAEASRLGAELAALEASGDAEGPEARAEGD